VVVVVVVERSSRRLRRSSRSTRRSPIGAMSLKDRGVSVEVVDVLDVVSSLHPAARTAIIITPTARMRVVLTPHDLTQTLHRG
jgi:hypothetical protein